MHLKEGFPKTITFLKVGSDLLDKFIPISVPKLKENELKYVTDSVETEWMSSGGAYIDRYESEFDKHHGHYHLFLVI